MRFGCANSSYDEIIWSTSELEERKGVLTLSKSLTHFGFFDKNLAPDRKTYNTKHYFQLFVITI